MEYDILFTTTKSIDVSDEIDKQFENLKKDNLNLLVPIYPAKIPDELLNISGKLIEIDLII